MFNTTILLDHIFRIYQLLPHCRILIRKHKTEVQEKLKPEAVKNLSVISTNCVGGEICHLAGLAFQSPMVNISMNRSEFVTLCTHLKEYYSSPLRVKRAENGSCIGTLNPDAFPEITIRFPHDRDPEKVLENWNRRCGRVNYDRLVLITDDRGMDEQNFESFDKIQAYKKICLTAKDRSSRYPWCYHMKCYDGQEQVGSYNGKSPDGMWKFVKLWDYCSFLNGE